MKTYRNPTYDRTDLAKFYSKKNRRAITRSVITHMQHNAWPQSLQRALLGGISKTTLNKFSDDSRTIWRGRDIIDRCQYISKLHNILTIEKQLNNKIVSNEGLYLKRYALDDRSIYECISNGSIVALISTINRLAAARGRD